MERFASEPLLILMMLLWFSLENTLTKWACVGNIKYDLMAPVDNYIKGNLTAHFSGTWNSSSITLMWSLVNSTDIKTPTPLGCSITANVSTFNWYTKSGWKKGKLFDVEPSLIGLMGEDVVEWKRERQIRSKMLWCILSLDGCSESLYLFCKI